MSDNPYTEQHPLVATDHPFRTNRAMLVTGAIVLAMALAYVVARVIRGERPVFGGGAVLMICLAVGIAAVLVWYAWRLSSGVRVTLTGREVRRQVRRGGPEANKTLAIDDIRLGLLATDVRYAKKRRGAELVLFGPGREILWLADGLEADDVHEIARALSARGIRRHEAPISNDQLRITVRKLRREQSTTDEVEP